MNELKDYFAWGGTVTQFMRQKKNAQLQSLNCLEINVLRVQMDIVAKNFKCGSFCLFTSKGPWRFLSGHYGKSHAH